MIEEKLLITKLTIQFDIYVQYIHMSVRTASQFPLMLWRIEWEGRNWTVERCHLTVGPKGLGRVCVIYECMTSEISIAAGRKFLIFNFLSSRSPYLINTDLCPVQSHSRNGRSQHISLWQKLYWWVISSLKIAFSWWSTLCPCLWTTLDYTNNTPLKPSLLLQFLFSYHVYWQE